MASRIECLLEIETGLQARQLRVVPFTDAGSLGLVVVHADTPDQQPSLPSFLWPEDTLKISAFTFGGEHLWLHDLGRGMIPGLWFCPVFPFDLDGDGRDEVYHIANGTPDMPFNKDAMEVSGLSTETGEVLRSARLPWFPNNQTMSDTFRYLINGGYSHGRPRLVTAQGCYHELAIHAWEGDLEPLWDRRIPNSEAGCRASHMFPVLDIDGDGRDEIFLGERCIDIDTGEDKWVADRDGYHGHSDIVMPTLDRKSGRWSIFTCREFPWPEGSCGVVMFGDQGQELWGYRGLDHVHCGWTARLCDDGTHRCFAVEVTKGEDPNVRRRKHHFFDMDGNRLELPFPLERTVPVDIDGDGLHELLYSQMAPPSWGAAERVGLVVDRHGNEVGRIEGGGPSPVGKLLDCPGEQILVIGPGAKLRVYGCPDAVDSPEAKARYAHPYYKSCQRLAAVGYNWRNLGGL